VLSAIASKQTDILEISPGESSPWKDLPARSYTAVDYPEFDITSSALARQFDIIIAEQVFEHLSDPDAAAHNVRTMLSDAGVFLIATPFLVKVHGPPAYGDYTRWTLDGLRLFLQRNGFKDVTVRAWGNRAAARANLYGWRSFGWGRDLSNDPDFTVVVWAYAHR
jgi:hypothetical protein